MKYHNFKKSSGFTLVELLISISIMTLVLLIIYSMFGFGNTTLVRASSQYDIQTNVRSAQDYITKLLRYPTEVTIMDSSITEDAGGNPLTPEEVQDNILPYENYIYLYENTTAKDVEVVHVNKYFIKRIPVGDSGELTFTSVSPFEEISFELDSNAVKGNQEYNVGSKIKCLNMDSTNSKIISVSGDKVVFFRTPSDYWAKELKPNPEFTENTNVKASVEFKNTTLILQNAEVYSYNQLDNTAADELVTTNTSSTMSVSNIKITASATKPVIILNCTFKDASDELYEYSYVLEYDVLNSKWTIL